MVSHELLILVIESRYPGLVHGRDYWVGHPLDEKGEHCGDAFIAAWHVGDRPDINELLAECDKFAPKLAEQKRESNGIRDSIEAIGPRIPTFPLNSAKNGRNIEPNFATCRNLKDGR